MMEGQVPDEAKAGSDKALFGLIKRSTPMITRIMPKILFITLEMVQKGSLGGIS